MTEHALERAAVILKAAYRYGDIPPAAAAVAHELEHAGRGVLALGADALGQTQADRHGAPFEASASVAEHLLGEPAQRRSLPGL